MNHRIQFLRKRERALAIAISKSCLIRFLKAPVSLGSGWRSRVPGRQVNDCMNRPSTSVRAKLEQAILSIERKPKIDPVLPGNGISICSAT